MKKKLVSALAVTLAVSCVLCGCGGGKESAKSEDGKTKIRFATWDTAGDVDKQQAMVDKFNEEHEDIEVTLEAYGQDFDTKISAGMGSGDTPDVMYMWNYPAYHEGLEPLDSYIEKEGKEYKDNIYEALWPYNSIDGSTYGIPVGLQHMFCSITKICLRRQVWQNRQRIGHGMTYGSSENNHRQNRCKRTCVFYETRSI